MIDRTPFSGIRIFIISLKTAKKRQERIIKEYPELAKQAEWIYVDKEKEQRSGISPQISNFNNHQKAIKIAKRNNYEKIIIFEDDIELLVPWKDFEKKIEEIKFPKNWKYIMLGYLPVKVTKTSDSSLYSIDCAFDAHAYIVNVKSVKTIFPDEKTNDIGGIDGVLFCHNHAWNEIFEKPQIIENEKEKSSQNGIYGIYPMLVKQTLEDSTLSAQHMDQLHFFNFYAGYDNVVRLSSAMNTLHFIVIIFIWIFLILGLVALFFSRGPFYYFLKYFLFFLFLTSFITFLVMISLGSRDFVLLEYP